MKSALIVDDEETILHIISTLLKEENYDITTSKTGISALREIKSKKFDIIIIDLLLPGEVDGLTLIKEIKKTGSKIPMIIISAYWDEKPEVKSYVEKIAYACLSKPFDINKIRELIKKVGKE